MLIIASIILIENRQSVFDGDLHAYIYQLSFITFTIIRNTVSIYSSCFPSTSMSACVKWAKEHVDAFNVILERQLSAVDPESGIGKDCIARAKKHAKMLESVGMDFTELVGRGIAHENSETLPRGDGLGITGA
jgi:exocyst complex component 8